MPSNRSAGIYVIAFLLFGVLDARSQSCDSPPLSEASSYPAGGATSGLAVGDLDGDGDTDIVAARPAANAVAVLLNDGAGGFGAPQLVAVGSAPAGIAIADFDEDGDLDLAVANSQSNSVSVLPGNGDGTFGAATTLTTGTEPRAVATGDFYGDSNVDIVVANAGSNSVQVFNGNGTGTFAAPVTRTNSSLIRPVALAVAKFHPVAGDDFAVVAKDTATALLFRGGSATGPALYNSFPTGTAPVGVVVDEFSHDSSSTMDAVVANQGSNSLTVQLMSGNFVFVRSTVPLPGPPSAISSGDFNGDHRADVVVTSEAMNEVWLLYNSGPRTFAAPIRYRLGGGSPSVTAADMDGDGKPEAVVSLPDAAAVGVLKGATWPAASKPYVMVIADTSTSMANSTGVVSSCAYGNSRLAAMRCALMRLFASNEDTAEFGLASYAMRQSNCAAACFTSCQYSAFPQESAGLGCGPRPGDATTRAGAFIRVPVQQDDPSSASNRAALTQWVDNNCADNKELFASGGGTPLNGALRDVKRYFAGTWAAPDGSVSYPSPLSANDRSCRSLNIILITDGDETCDTQADAVAAASNLRNTPFMVGGQAFTIRTYVINLVAGSQANADAIAIAGGSASAYFATDEVQLGQAIESVMGDILFSANPLESCNLGDDNCNSCSDEGWQHPPSASNSGPVCAGGSAVELRANTYPGATYSWSGPNGFTASGQYTTVSSASAVATGTYTFTADVGGCISVSASTQVTVNAPPNASISAPDPVSSSGSASASVPNAGGGASYEWVVTGASFTGQGTNSITFMPAAGASTVSLDVTVQTAAGCMASASRSVTVVSGRVFTDDPLVSAVTTIKALHLSELRDAVNATRAEAGMQAATWAEPATAGLVIKASQVNALRAALSPALVALGVTPAYTDPGLTAGDLVKAIHFQEIRNYTK